MKASRRRSPLAYTGTAGTKVAAMQHSGVVTSTLESGAVGLRECARGLHLYDPRNAVPPETVKQAKADDLIDLLVGSDDGIQATHLPDRPLCPGCFAGLGRLATKNRATAEAASPNYSPPDQTRLLVEQLGRERVEWLQSAFPEKDLYDALRAVIDGALTPGSGQLLPLSVVPTPYLPISAVEERRAHRQRKLRANLLARLNALAPPKSGRPSDEQRRSLGRAVLDRVKALGYQVPDESLRPPRRPDSAGRG